MSAPEKLDRDQILVEYPDDERHKRGVQEAPDTDCNKPDIHCCDLLQAIKRVEGKSDQLYFGPERQGDIFAEREVQITALRTEVEAPVPPDADPVFTGGEHEVWIGGIQATVVIKQTKAGRYGSAIDEKVFFDERTFLNKSKLYLRPALPSEYFRRWLFLKIHFGLLTTYLGVREVEDPRIMISQPFIDQNDDDLADAEDVHNFMTAYKFDKVANEFLVHNDMADGVWYRAEDGILIADAFPRNFRKDRESQILIPVDLMVATVPQGASKILS